MSLFPAYSNENVIESPNSNVSQQLQKDNTSTNWLSNSSFQTYLQSQTLVVDISSDNSSDNDFSTSTDVPSSNTSSHENKHSYYNSIKLVKSRTSEERKKTSKHTKKRKKERKSSSKKKNKYEYERDVANVYFEDKHRDRGNSTVNTLCSRARPYYNVGQKYLGFVSYKQIKKNIYQRYHAYNIDLPEKTKKNDLIIKREIAKDTTINKNEEIPSWCTNLEEEQTLKTREYNEKLLENPKNIKLWLEYIEFQDTLTKFQKHQLAKNIQRSTVLRKLSIVEKALEKNSDCIELLKLKLRFMEEISPADEFSKEMETLVNKDTGNVILWQALIMATQGSVAMCTVPKVLDLYTKCFCILRQRSRTNPRIYDERLLEMLYQCLVFLRHTGLWEQMWETIRLNLILNLNLNRDSLVFKKIIDEKKLIGMEEVVLMSRLPLNQLWLRTESLRENCHWISVSKEELELVGDSRRFVIPEDVADFVHPIISRDSNFRMAIYSLLVLKIPLLPTRNCILKNLGLKEFAWGVDSSEVLFPFAYPIVGEMAGHKKRKALMHGILEGHLTSGPQYLKFHPAQEPYLDFIRETFHTIADNLPNLERNNIYVWWLRFERLLVFLNKDEPLKYDNKGKKLKSILKEFLKKDVNRNNLHFYKEYALIEREMGRFESCINILETAIQSNCTCPSMISDHEEKAALFNLYRTLFETLLNTETYKEAHKEKILNVIKHMVPGSTDTQLLLVEKYLRDCVNNFLKTEPMNKDIDTFFLPNLDCDVIVCYTLFLYVKNNNIEEIINIYKCCIEHCKESHLQEMIYESELVILQLHYENFPDLDNNLNKILHDMLELYPDNFYALSIYAHKQSELPSWKINNTKSEFSVWKALSLCLAGRKRTHFLMQLDHDAACASRNKLLSLHRIFARTPEIRYCPLLWRIYMLLLREHNLCEKKGEEVYHESVALCPWARSIYIDAAEVAPQLLTQIQDVIREKELRMHVTPEELNILRGHL
ncbi:nuclear exosome regulator NRDE2-like [Vespa mandarinia]|uniref:nuclear exosome regulator NRDE2-like n=1 Tax=Vespa mandarinia TaxID=7446 RepID=UPI001619543A|nr:nuclear exosome regulator NRDE2-like [Vespa mandarinia]